MRGARGGLSAARGGVGVVLARVILRRDGSLYFRQRDCCLHCCCSHYLRHRLRRDLEGIVC